MKKKKKLILGITIPDSVALLPGQVDYFVKKDYDVCLLTSHNTKSLDFCRREGCRPLTVEIEREISLLQDIVSLFSIIQVYKREKPDIVNVGTPKMGLLGIVAAWILGVPLRIYTCRGFRYEHEKGLRRYVLKACEKICGFCAHKIICISPSVQKLGINEGIFPAHKCIVINKGSSNGIDPSVFSRQQVSENARNEILDRYCLEGKFVYGFLGRIVDRKGINELYEAFLKIYNEDNNCRLFLVGPWGHNQIANKYLYRQMKEHPGIIVVGEIDYKDVPLYMSVMDVFVLPAWWEGFGNVVVQAADMGIPVIGSTGTGICDAVSDGFNGINVPPKNVEVLQDAMLELKKNNHLREKYGSNGILWGQNFRNDIIWDGMRELYENLN